MKRKYQVHFQMLMVVAIAFAACSEETPPYEELTDSKEGAAIFIAKAHDGLQNLTIFPYTDERTFQFGVGYGALGLPASDISISLVEDVAAFDSLNAAREKNGLAPYERFPQQSYGISTLALTIPKGGMSSDLATLTYYPNEFDPTKDHLLALSIDNASGYTVNAATKTIFIVAPKLEERPANTEGWVASASSQQDNGQENTGLASAVLDNDPNTIWHSQYSPERPNYPHWLSFDMGKSVYVTKIGLVARQNNANGFTKFKLEGSNNEGIEWFDLSGTLDFDPATKTVQAYPITAQELTNIRITLLEGLQDVTFLADIIVYTF